MISPSLYPHLLSLHLLPPLLLLPSPPLFSSSSHLFSPHLSSAPLLPSFPHFFSALPQVEQSLVAWLKLSGNKAKLYQINGSQTRDGGNSACLNEHACLNEDAEWNPTQVPGILQVWINEGSMK